MTEIEVELEYYRAIDLIKKIKREETHKKYVDRHKALALAIQALEENKAYRAIGTVEECAYAKRKVHIAELATEQIEKIEQRLKAFESIGTVEEFKALKEKAEPKKVVRCKSGFMCPTCGYDGLVYFASDGNDKNCSECGQALIW